MPHTGWTSGSSWPVSSMGTVGGKLLRGNIMAKQRFWLKPSHRILDEDRPGRGDITWRMVEKGELEDRSRVTRQGEWRVHAKVT